MSAEYSNVGSPEESFGRPFKQLDGSMWSDEMTDQRILAQHVLDTITTSPQVPTGGRYLTSDQAERIVDETVDYVGRHCDAVAYKYLMGHRRRLAISLTFIPKAESDDASCLDIGCYGYMAFWAWKYLGYKHVEGIELRADAHDERLDRQIKFEDETLDLTVHNFDIASADWPLQTTFDAVLFFETLEHVNSDPMGIMLNVARRMRSDSTLVMSVPNSVSYQTLQEFIAGMPPWTYWFFHPDLGHEPRHAFEYTPFILKFLLRASGFDELAFRTICAYNDRKDLDDIFMIGEELSINSHLFGETMLVQARKNPELEIIRYPDCIYSNEKYYRSTFPVLESKRRRAIKAFLDSRRQNEQNLAAVKGKLAVTEGELHELEKKADSSESRIRELEAQKSAAAEEFGKFKTEAEAARRRIDEMVTQLSEALFLCDRYLAKVSATEAQLKELRARVGASGGRIRELEAAEERLQAILGSTSWRLTSPIRRIMTPFPRLRFVIRLIFVPLWRVGRAIARGGGHVPWEIARAGRGRADQQEAAGGQH